MIDRVLECAAPATGYGMINATTFLNHVVDTKLMDQANVNMLPELYPIKTLVTKKSRDHPCCACCLIANLNSHTRRLPSWPDASWMPGARLCWPRRCPEWHPLLRWQGNCVCPWCASGSLAGKEISGHSLLRSFWDSNNSGRTREVDSLMMIWWDLWTRVVYCMHGCVPKWLGRDISALAAHISISTP